MSEENRKKAAALHEQACSIEDPEVALAQYHEVLALDPQRPTTLYNIGLIHKYRSEWNESLLFNRRSVELDSTDEAEMFYKSERQKWSDRLRHALDVLVTEESLQDKASAVAEMLHSSVA